MGFPQGIPQVSVRHTPELEWGQVALLPVAVVGVGAFGSDLSGISLGFD